MIGLGRTAMFAGSGRLVPAGHRPCPASGQMVAAGPDRLVSRRARWCWHDYPLVAGYLADMTGCARLRSGGCAGEVVVRAVVMVFRGRFRQHWKSWLALSVLVAVAGGFVMSAAAAGRRTAAAFPEFAARHGYDVSVYSGQPLPQMTRLPHVASVTPVLVPISGALRCPSCRKPIDTENFLINEVPPRQLPGPLSAAPGCAAAPGSPSRYARRCPWQA